MAIKFQKEPMNAHSSIKHVIGVVSGKGGVGKSFVTASMAAAMRKKGYEVGIMDADITGPSIPKMYGIHGKQSEMERDSSGSGRRRNQDYVCKFIG